jgi:WD40 repeat protein
LTRHTLVGHQDSVLACTISPDSRFVVSGSADGTLKIWDASTGAERATLRGHEGPVSDCAITSDGRSIVSVSGDCKLKVWDLESGQERFTLEGPVQGITRCAVAPDGSFAVTGGRDGCVGIWDLAARQVRTVVQAHTREVYGCAISPDALLIASTSLDGNLKLCDSVTGEEQAKLAFPMTVPQLGCAFSHDGAFIATTVEDGVCIWDVAARRKKNFLSAEGILLRCAISPDDQLVVTAGALVKSLVDLKDNSPVVFGEFHSKLMISSLASLLASEDKSSFALGEVDARLSISDVRSGSMLLTMSEDDVRDCDISPDGSFIVSAGGRARTLRIWDTEKCLARSRASRCFVATAAWGTDQAPDVLALQHYRDRVLRRTRVGRAFLAAYERVSPGIARLIAGAPLARRITRALVIRPAAWLARTRNGA